MQGNQEKLQKIEQIVKSERVVLFMKGTPNAPQCGFSASVVQILNGLLPEYRTVNVLEDPGVRQGIKDYSSWPTIPQLFVEGEFLGGCDIVREMFASGELQKLLGVTPEKVEKPTVTITPAAAKALTDALGEAEPGDRVHISIDPRFEHSLGLAPADPNAVVVESGGIELCLDVASARRASGLVIDFVDRGGEAGFKIENPNAPPRVKRVTPRELKERLDRGERLALFDVRTPEECARAAIEGARRLDDEAVEHIGALDKETLLVFYCHRGARSHAAAEHFLEKGFKNVYNLAGGIDAWSVEVDPKVPRY
jgi:monothiol glutaredoxin